MWFAYLNAFSACKHQYIALPGAPLNSSGCCSTSRQMSTQKTQSDAPGPCYIYFIIVIIITMNNVIIMIIIALYQNVICLS